MAPIPPRPHSSHSTRLTPAPHPLLASLNGLLESLYLPLHLPSLTLATPSLLLSILESLLETRLSIPTSVRSSWERKHRTQIAEFLVRAIGEVGEGELAVDVRGVVRGDEEEVGKLVGGLLRIAEGMGIQFDDEGYPQGSSSDVSLPSTSNRSSGNVRQSTPPPNRLRTTSNPRDTVSLRSLVTLTTPPTVLSPPITPRSTLRLMRMGGKMPSPPSPPRQPNFAPGVGRKAEEGVESRRDRGTEGNEVLRPIARRVDEMPRRGDEMEAKDWDVRRDGGKGKGRASDKDEEQYNMFSSVERDDLSSIEVKVERQPRMNYRQQRPDYISSSSSSSHATISTSNAHRSRPTTVKPVSKPLRHAPLRSHRLTPPPPPLPLRPAAAEVHSPYHLFLVREKDRLSRWLREQDRVEVDGR